METSAASAAVPDHGAADGGASSSSSFKPKHFKTIADGTASRKDVLLTGKEKKYLSKKHKELNDQLQDQNYILRMQYILTMQAEEDSPDTLKDMLQQAIVKQKADLLRVGNSTSTPIGQTLNLIAAYFFDSNVMFNGNSEDEAAGAVSLFSVAHNWEVNFCVPRLLYIMDKCDQFPEIDADEYLRIWCIDSN